MEIVNDRFYIGFDGEPEIQFIRKNKDIVNKLILWEGYFDEIMRLIKPANGGWTSLAYYYHMYTGWYEESPWRVEDPELASKQIESVDKTLLEQKTVQALEEIIHLFKDALDNNEEIYIGRE